MAALTKNWIEHLRHQLEKQGCVCTWSRKGLRVKAPNGKVTIVHMTPRRRELYMRTLDKGFETLGLTRPEGGWGR